NNSRARFDEAAQGIRQFNWVTGQGAYIVLNHEIDVSLFLTGYIATENDRQVTSQGLTDRAGASLGDNHIGGAHHFWHVLHKTKNLCRNMQIGTSALKV